MSFALEPRRELARRARLFLLDGKLYALKIPPFFSSAIIGTYSCRYSGYEVIRFGAEIEVHSKVQET